MADTNDILIEALLDEVLDKSLTDAVAEAVRVLQGNDGTDHEAAIVQEQRALEGDRDRLVRSIATGRDKLNREPESLVLALGACEERLATLEATRAALRAERRGQGVDVTKVRRELLAMVTSWRRVLADDPTNARPIVAGLLKGRVTIRRGPGNVNG